MTIRKSAVAALCGVSILSLSACADMNADDGYRNTRNNAALGGLLGAATGAIIGGDAKGAAIGGVVGGIAGAAYGGYLDQQERELRGSLGGDVQITNTGDRLIVTMPQDILFAVDSDYVGTGLKSDLRVLARSLNDYPNTTVDVIGHTDNTGDAAYNQDLSNRRARAVADVLYDAGVATSRIRAYGRGEDEPVASNLTPEGRAQNRRVEIIIRPMS